MKHSLTWLLRRAALVAIVLLVFAGALAGVEFRDRSDARLQSARAEAEGLRTRTVELDARTDEVRSQVLALQERVDTKDLTVAELTARLERSVPAEQHAALQARFDTTSRDYEALLAWTKALLPIRTPELSGDALLLDRSVPNVTYTGAVCSGSMEPNITCDDLLILYRAAVTDLDVGDIIYFRRPNADCTGHTERFMLHRISRVVAASTGLSFETKGDAFSTSDACRVPSADVLYKLLTTVRGARISGESS